jgi:hypothetical protein
MTRALLVPVILAFAGTACMHAGHAASAAATQPSTVAPAGGMAGVCPMSVPGTKLSAADTSTGEAITFTTTPDQATALREKVHAMADMHNRHHASGGADQGGMKGMHGGGMMGDMEMPPPSRAVVEDLPDGARIIVTPNDPADLERLQKTVRMHAEHMQQHGCGMMDHARG